MTEGRPTRPDIREVLRMLRERAGDAAQPPHIEGIDDQGVVRRISEEVATLTGVRVMRPAVGHLVGELTGRIGSLGTGVRFQQVGTVQRVGSGVVTLSGLPQVQTNELVTFPTGVQGLVLNLEQDSVDVILLGPSQGIQGGDLVTATDERLRIPVGHSVLGRVVDPLAEPLDRQAGAPVHLWT